MVLAITLIRELARIAESAIILVFFDRGRDCFCLSFSAVYQTFRSLSHGFGYTVSEVHKGAICCSHIWVEGGAAASSRLNGIVSVVATRVLVPSPRGWVRISVVACV
jgi:hypothetical protein